MVIPKFYGEFKDKNLAIDEFLKRIGFDTAEFCLPQVTWYFDVYVQVLLITLIMTWALYNRRKWIQVTACIMNYLLFLWVPLLAIIVGPMIHDTI